MFTLVNSTPAQHLSFIPIFLELVATAARLLDKGLYIPFIGIVSLLRLSDAGELDASGPQAAWRISFFIKSARLTICSEKSRWGTWLFSDRWMVFLLIPWYAVNSVFTCINHCP
jgi:hypothetical protein